MSNTGIYLRTSRSILLLGTIFLLFALPSRARSSEIRRRDGSSNPIQMMITNAIGAGQNSITVPAGVYSCQLIVNTKRPFTITCDPGVTTKYGKSSIGQTNSQSAALRVQGCPDFKMYGCQVVNTFYTTSSTGQAAPALAVSVEGSGARASFYGTTIKGWQDTLYFRTGTQLFCSQCHILGVTDYLFGEGIAVVQDSNIDSQSGKKTTIAASRGANGGGIYFKRCGFTLNGAFDQPGNTYLGRPWDDEARTGLFNCKLGDHIGPQGFTDWDSSRKASDPSVTYVEYESVNRSGEPVNTQQRYGTRELSATEVRKYTLKNIFGDVSWIDTNSQ